MQCHAIGWAMGLLRSIATVLGSNGKWYSLTGRPLKGHPIIYDDLKKQSS